MVPQNPGSHLFLLHIFNAESGGIDSSPDYSRDFPTWSVLLRGNTLTEVKKRSICSFSPRDYYELNAGNREGLVEKNRIYSDQWL